MKKYTKKEIAELCYLYAYDPNLGIIIKRNSEPLKRHIHKNKNVNYYLFWHKGRAARYHRVCYILMTGKNPDLIDHIDGDGTNNKWSNIRSVSNGENLKNQRRRKDNKTGFTGVVDNGNGKYRAEIQVNYKKIRLGIYDKIKDAIEAREKANIKYGFHPNHGR